MGHASVWCEWIGHYSVVVVKDTRALNPFQTPGLDAGQLVILAATLYWYPIRDLNPENLDFESSTSANSVNRIYCERFSRVATVIVVLARFLFWGLTCQMSPGPFDPNLLRTSTLGRMS